MLSFLVSCTLLMTTAITVFWKGLQQARFYLLGWTVFLGSVVVITLWKMGIITSTHFLVYNAFPIGTMLEAALFSFALADRIRIFRQEADDARSLSLKRLEENEKLLTQYQRIQEQNRQLQEKNARVVPVSYTHLDVYKRQLQIKDALYIALGMAAGAYLGALLSTHLDANILRKAFAVLLVLMAVKLWLG